MKGKLKFIIPLVVFVALAGFLAAGLKLDPREVPSPLIGNPSSSSRCCTTRAAASPAPTCWASRGSSTCGPRGVRPAKSSTRC